LKNPSQKKAGGVAEDESPELKPKYHKQTNKKAGGVAQTLSSNPRTKKNTYIFHRCGGAHL
jgi:hypothetical protein